MGMITEKVFVCQAARAGRIAGPAPARMTPVRPRLSCANATYTLSNDQIISKQLRTAAYLSLIKEGACPTPSSKN